MLSNLSNNLILLSLIGIFSLLGLFFSIFALWKIRQINQKNETIFSGKSVRSLESLIMEHSHALTHLDKEVQELFEISNKVHSLAFRGIHKTHVLRFNPFNDIGGNQSFVVALLNGKNSGVVISSLHTREGTRSYAKPIVKGKCEEYQLTEEEKKALSEAMLQKGIKL